MLGLPDGVTACLFDLDGVLTKTATVHAAAWKRMFDAFLAVREGQPPFDAREDYARYVDGMPRSDGVRAFLALIRTSGSALKWIGASAVPD